MSELQADRRAALNVPDTIAKSTRSRDALIALAAFILLALLPALTSSKFYDRDRVEPLGRSIALATGQRDDRPGRVIEAAIPWSLLGGFEPAAGRVIGLALNGTDSDGPNRPRGFFGWPSPRSDRTGPIGPWVRPDKPTDFGHLVFTR